MLKLFDDYDSPHAITLENSLGDIVPTKVNRNDDGTKLGTNIKSAETTVSA